MTHRQLAAWTAFFLLACVPAHAEEPDSDVQPEPKAINCDEADLPGDLREVCDGLAESLSAVMQAPSGSFNFARVTPKPLDSRQQVRTTVIASGLDAKRDLSDPFQGLPDKAVGVQVAGTTLPLELATQVIQPADPAAGDRLTWELKANLFRGREGIFVSGTAAGNYDSAGGQETVTARAGYRGSVQILDNVRIGSEIAPQLNWTEAAVTAAVEPKLTTAASFDRLGETGLSATLSGDIAYSLPAEGEPSARGAVRLTFRPR